MREDVSLSHFVMESGKVDLFVSFLSHFGHCILYLLAYLYITKEQSGQ